MKTDPRPYGGTKESFKNIGHINDPISAALLLVDIPLSIIGDTIMLPADVKDKTKEGLEKECDAASGEQRNTDSGADVPQQIR